MAKAVAHVVLLFFLCACSSGDLTSNDAQPDRGDISVVDPCVHISCPSDRVCEDGQCVLPDLCEEVECHNQGEACDPRDGSCRAGGADDDHDGVTIAQGDCDDGDDQTYPGAPELCDGRDQDCNRQVDDGFPDADTDGYDTCGQNDVARADCDDTDPDRHPGGAEVCDGKDNDCNDDADDNIPPEPCETACGSGQWLCENGTPRCSVTSDCTCQPPGKVGRQRCNFCGQRRRTCLDLGDRYEWGEWGDCDAEGECAAGDTDSQTCGNCREGTSEAECGQDCFWDSWSECTVGGQAGTCLGCAANVGSGNDGIYLTRGFYGQESDEHGSGRWMAQVGELHLGRVPPGTRFITFTWHARSLTPTCQNEGGNRGGRVIVDGQDVGRILIGDGQHQVVSYPIPNGAADDQFLEITIRGSDYFVPQVCIPGSSDTRELSIKIYHVDAC